MPSLSSKISDGACPVMQGASSQVRSKSEAIEKIDWYAMRWKIETFHKILKSGCRAEDSRLRTADRLTNLIAIYCILSWRIFWMTMLNRTAPEVHPSKAFTDVEITVLDRLTPKTAMPEFMPRTLLHYATQLANLGAISRAKAIHRRATPSCGVV
jgi:Transposase DDE domain